MYFDPIQHATNPRSSTLLMMIQVSTLPGLSHVIAVTGWTVELKIDISINLQFQIVTKKSLQQNEGYLSLVPYCTNQKNKCLYSFLSSPTDCVWSHLPQHPNKPALPQNLNIIMGLKPKQCLRIYEDMSGPDFIAQQLSL